MQMEKRDQPENEPAPAAAPSGPPPPAPELWQGRIERLGWGGLGLSKLADGRALLLAAPLAIFPGEEVEAEIEHKARHSEGRVVRWLRPDRARVEPACPVAERCGGCSMWGSGAAYGELKRQQIADLLARQLKWQGRWDWLPAEGAARRLALRHRIQLHWDGARLGYHQPGSHRIVEAPGCPVAVPELSAAIPALREALEQRLLPRATARWELACGTPAAEVLAYRMDSGGGGDELTPAGQQPPEPVWRLNSSGRWQEGRRPIWHQLGGGRLLQPPGAFFQVCPEWAWECFGQVFNGWKLGGEVLYDIYSGVGFFSRLLAPRFRRFRLLEGSALACSALSQNLGGLDYEVRQQDAATWDARGPQLADTVLLDPPRAGLPARLSASLSECRAGSLVLIGCDGAAFSRDVQRLGPQWRLESLAVADLFPNTSQAEFIGLLRRESLSARR